MCTIMLVSCSFGREICVSLHQKGCGSAATPFGVNLHAFLFKSVDIKLISVFDPHWVGAKVHVTICVDLYSGQILVFSMTLMTVCV